MVGPGTMFRNLLGHKPDNPRSPRASRAMAGEHDDDRRSSANEGDAGRGRRGRGRGEEALSPPPNSPRGRFRNLRWSSPRSSVSSPQLPQPPPPPPDDDDDEGGSPLVGGAAAARYDDRSGRSLFFSGTSESSDGEDVDQSQSEAEFWGQTDEGSAATDLRGMSVDVRGGGDASSGGIGTPGRRGSRPPYPAGMNRQCLSPGGISSPGNTSLSSSENMSPHRRYRPYSNNSQGVVSASGARGRQISAATGVRLETVVSGDIEADTKLDAEADGDAAGGGAGGGSSKVGDEMMIPVLDHRDLARQRSGAGSRLAMGNGNAIDGAAPLTTYAPPKALIESRAGGTCDAGTSTGGSKVSNRHRRSRSGDLGAHLYITGTKEDVWIGMEMDKLPMPGSTDGNDDDDEEGTSRGDEEEQRPHYNPPAGRTERRQKRDRDSKVSDSDGGATLSSASSFKGNAPRLPPELPYVHAIHGSKRDVFSAISDSDDPESISRMKTPMARGGASERKRNITFSPGSAYTAGSNESNFSWITNRLSVWTKSDRSSAAGFEQHREIQPEIPKRSFSLTPAPGRKSKGNNAGLHSFEEKDPLLRRSEMSDDGSLEISIAGDDSVEASSQRRGQMKAQRGETYLREGAYTEDGLRRPSLATKTRARPMYSITEHEGDKYPTFICPRCNTKQRNFFTVNSAPRQFESPAGYLAFYMSIYVVASLFIFGLEEGWPPMDCVYFAVITLTTAGLGDYVPSTDGAKIICSIFIYFGVACIGLLLGSLLASGLDDASRKQAKENMVNNCSNCAHIQNLRRISPTVQPTYRGNADNEWLGDQSGSNAGQHSGTKVPLSPYRRRGVSDVSPYGSTDLRSTSEGSHHGPRGNDASPMHNPANLRRAMSDVVPTYNHVGHEGDLNPSYNPVELERMPSDGSQHGPHASGASPSHSVGGVPTSGDFNDFMLAGNNAHSPTLVSSALAGQNYGSIYSFSPVYDKNRQQPSTLPPMTPPTPPPSFLPLAPSAQHTRHMSYDFPNVALDMPPGSHFRERNYASVRFGNEQNRTSFSARLGNGEGIRPHSARNAYPVDNNDTFFDSDSDSESSSSSTDSYTSEDPFKPLSRVQSAKYVFLTLQQALANSVFIITIGSFGFFFIERMTAVDAFYFTTVLLTTVGYGDIVPQTEEGKMFATIYVLVAGTVLLHNMSLISMIPIELRKRRVERAVLRQFGDQLDDAALRELATGPLVQRLQLRANRQDGLDECTREMFSLAMLVRLGRISEQDVQSTFAAFRSLDIDNDGKLNSRDIIMGEARRRQNMMRLSRSQNDLAAQAAAAVGAEAEHSASNDSRPAPVPGQTYYSTNTYTQETNQL